MITLALADNSGVGNPKTENDKKKAGKDLTDEEIVRIAKERFNLAVEYEAATRIEEMDDLKFMAGEQWPADVRNGRLQDNRPCLTINRIPQFVRQVTNDQRQNRPSIKINPVDDKADEDTSQVIQGMVRHIEYNSHADIAYDTSFESSAKSGLGYWRVVTEYADPMSFQQEIKIKRIKDRFSVYLDIHYQEPDGSDAEWGFVFEDMSEDEFKVKYKDSKLSKMSDWESLGSQNIEWIKKESVRIAEYYYKTYEETTIVLLTDGTVIEKDQLPAEMPQGVRVVSERKTLIPKVKWVKINGIEILEKTEVPGEWIPIIPVIGEEQFIDGKKIFSGIIRHAKDPQRMLNYWKSCETEAIALAPRAPFIGSQGQFEGHEDKWESANTKNHAYLEYNDKSSGGTPLPPPQRQAFEPAVQAITQAANASAEDLKATTGIYDSSLGNKSNEQSGIAIQRRNVQSQTSNFHYIDNLSRSLRHTGRILVAWIPKIYDTAQVARVIGEDGTIDMVKINQVFKEGGEDKGHFLNLGHYDVTVDTGPSFATKRQEAVASMLDLLRSAPQLMQMAGDLLVRSMDWPGAQEIADRIKKTLPPNIVDDSKDQQPVPPQVQAQMQQMSQMLQSLDQECAKYAELLRTKKLELESRERIALGEQETQLKVEILKHDAKDAQLIFQAELGRIDKRLDLLNNNQPIDSESGGNPAATPDQSQSTEPTGGNSPGQSMGAP